MDAKLIVTSRDLKGSANARRMRRDGIIPGVIYSGGKEAREVLLPKHAFEQMLRHHSSKQMMVAIELDGKDGALLLKDVQHDMLGRGVLHVDFMEVSLTEKIKVQFTVELVGEPTGVKNRGGTLDHALYSVDVACFPGDILETIEVDVSALDLGDVLTVRDIKVDAAKYTILTDGDIVVASVLAPRVAAEAVVEGAEPEVLKEKKPKA